jgi:hypothetical protein
VRSAACALLLVLLAGTVDAQTPRHRAPVEAFRRAHPCPATGQTTGSCPGYVVDHKKPLCAGGPDTPENMQWQKYADSLVKDRVEIGWCRSLAQVKALTAQLDALRAQLEQLRRR